MRLSVVRRCRRLATQYGWGEIWADPTLTPRECSILTLGMLAALGKMHAFESHCRGALNNGLTPNEIRAVLTQIAVYYGFPVGVDCFASPARLSTRRRRPERVGNEEKVPGTISLG